MKKTLLALTFLLSSLLLNAQLLTNKQVFSKADSLRGTLSKLRTCYDINYYHLEVKIDIDQKFISGQNEFSFTATQNFKTLQFDLFENLKVDKIVYKNREVPFTRSFNAVFVNFPTIINKGEKDKFTVYYSGNPIIAKNAPWDGGFIFKKDTEGNPFVSVACQGLGASSWWPNKDHQSDEVDSMRISISAPQDLQVVANGRLQNIEQKKDGYTQYNWLVQNPINNYNIAFYIGKYAHWKDTFNGKNGPLDIDYWSLKVDSAKAKPHWDADVKPMLKCFEEWFGPYPFYKDGYKLVQAPHLGMEHQSAVAYGNRFLKGYLGRDNSGTGHGLKWDFITIHESGHEWFGNNITAKDIADMWIHEAFTTYSEVIYTECNENKEAANAYLIGIRKGIKNDSPIIGHYGVNVEGSGDMYNKGANLIHNIRQLINNDEKFKQILVGLNKTFYHQTVTSSQIENYIAKQSGLKLNKIFDQYLRAANIPTFTYQFKEGYLYYRWEKSVKDFDMPIKVNLYGQSFQFIKPSTKWKKLKLEKNWDQNNFKIDPLFYVNTVALN